MDLPLPLANTGGGVCKEFLVVGGGEGLVREKIIDEWGRRLGNGGEGERLVSVEEGKGGSRRRLKSLMGAKDMLSSKTVLKVKEEMMKAVEGEGEGEGEKYKVLFDGLKESEVEGLEAVKNILIWGNAEGGLGEVGWGGGGLVTGRPGASGGGGGKKNKRGSWVSERLSALSMGSGKEEEERKKEEAEREKKKRVLEENKKREIVARIGTAGKRMHDALEEIAKLRNKGLWRCSEGPLRNLYQVLLVICGFFGVEGLAVEDGSFDKLYERAIGRLNLRHQEWMEQSDMELHHDTAKKEEVEARMVFGLLL